jgi:hypothetical protein
MGWKAAIVLGKSSVEWIPSAETTRHDPAALDTLCADSGLSRLTLLEVSDLNYGMYPFNQGEIAVTVANGSGGESFAAIGDCDAGGEMVGWHATHPYVQAMVRRFPKGVVVVLELQSVSEYWAFAVYERGRFVRAMSGADEVGILVNEGEPLPEEQVALEHGQLCGETLVFEVSRRMFGETVVDIPLERWPCTLFKRYKPWWRLW